MQSDITQQLTLNQRLCTLLAVFVSPLAPVLPVAVTLPIGKLILSTFR